MTAWLPVLLPAAGALSVALLGGRRRPGPVAVAWLMAALAAAVVAAANGAEAAWSWGPSLSLGLGVEGPGRVMVVLVPAVAVPVVGFAASSLRHDPALGRLLALMLGFVAGMELLVSAADFLSLLVGWELVGATSWALIGHEWRDPANPASAREAFVTTRVGDVGLYVAAGAALAGGGSLAFADLPAVTDPWLGVIAAGVVLAAAAKSAQLPFSPWLFSAMAGPTPVSALLHSATMVAAGAYLLLRLQPVLAPVTWFAPLVVGLGLVTALAGGLVALAQTDLKRALAGSTSAQYGLILVAAGAGYTAAGMGHLGAHALFKALLFLGAGVAIHSAGTGDLGKLRLGSTLPRVAALFGVGTAALAAVPPLGGAFTKETVLAAGFQAGTWAGAGAVVAGMLSALYAGRLQLLAYGPGPRLTPAKRPLIGERVAMGALAAASLGLGLAWLPGGEGVVETVTGGALAEGAPWLLGGSLGTIAVALGVVAVLWRRDLLLAGGWPEPVRRFIAGWWGMPQAARRLVVDPVSALSQRLWQTDRRAVDGAVRAVAQGVAAASRGLRRSVETLVDRTVEGVGSGTAGAASAARSVDEEAVDGAVEALAAGVGLAGEQSRRLQSGMSHRYYTLLAAGTAAAFLVAGLWR